MSERLATPLESVLGSDADREWVRARAAEHTLSCSDVVLSCSGTRKYIFFSIVTRIHPLKSSATGSRSIRSVRRDETMPLSS